MPLSQPYLNIKKRHYKPLDVDEKLLKLAQEANKAIMRAIVLKFEETVRSRGETVIGALNAIRARGFIISFSGLHQYKTGKFTTFNALPMNVLAQYAGYPSFIEMLTEGK